MIIIEARFARNQSPIFLNGELIEFFVTFSNKEDSDDYDPEDFDTLAWGSLQLNGYCQTKQLPNAANQLITTSKTCLASNNYSFFSTDLNILFCDLKLSPGESKSCKSNFIIIF